VITYTKAFDESAASICNVGDFDTELVAAGYQELWFLKGKKSTVITVRLEVHKLCG
jgi:hypothetical protein